MKTGARLTSPVDSRDYVRGSRTAPVTIVEYADYECSHSGQAYYALKRLGAEMGDTFRLVFRNFPLTQIRSNALPAALAAEAAGMQGAFWEMHDILYEHQDGLEPEHLIVYAQVLGLDIERFIIDLTSDAAAANVREDFIGGMRSGVNGTPTFYIDGLRHDETSDYEELRAAVEKAATSRTRNVKKAKTIIARGRASSRF